MKKLICIALALAAIVSNAATRTEQIREKLKSGDRNYVFVAMHRGDWRNFPENSTGSILSAIALGADIVELDVRRTKEGRFVLMHDKKIDRVLNGKGLLSKMTVEELKKLRFVKDGKTTDYTIVTLEEALELTRGKILINIDKFTENPHEILKAVDKVGALKEVLVKSTHSPEEAKTLFGEYWPRVESGEILYMPVVQFCWKKHDHAAKIFPEWLKEEPRAASMYELCFDSMDRVNDVLGSVRNAPGKPRIWINSMWDTLSAGHSDPQALTDPDPNWGWILDQGVTMIQTDCGAEMLLYLTRRGRHNL